jgi:hypothetical protein
VRGSRRDWHKSKSRHTCARRPGSHSRDLLARSVAGGLGAEHQWIGCQSGFEVDRQAVGVVSSSATYPLGTWLRRPRQVTPAVIRSPPSLAAKPDCDRNPTATETRLRQKGNELGRSLVAIILCSAVVAGIHTIRARLGIQGGSSRQLGPQTRSHHDAVSPFVAIARWRAHSQGTNPGDPRGRLCPRGEPHIRRGHQCGPRNHRKRQAYGFPV